MAPPPRRHPLHRAHVAVLRWVHAAPGTHVYLFVLLVTTGTVRSLHPALETELLRQVSTNLAQMGRSAGRVLFLSAFLLGGSRWLTTAVLFSAVYVPLERAIGTARWLATVVVGHVGATLVTTVGVWADVRANVGAGRLTNTIDVGVSYGFFAAAVALTFVLPRWWLRWPARLALALRLGIPAIATHTFTDVGHVAAGILGAAMWFVMLPPVRPRWWRPAPDALPARTAPAP